MTSIIDKAMAIALEAHLGQINKHDSEPYILHVHRVAMNVAAAGFDDRHVAIAWLHDVLEDTSVTAADLLVAFPEDTNLVADVVAITKIKGETLVDYYTRLRARPRAARVKYHGDRKDNFRRNHLIADEATRLRMAAKYSLCEDMLGDVV